MDRTNYGKSDPGERQPYRCTVRVRGIAPACKYNQLMTMFDMILMRYQ